MKYYSKGNYKLGVEVGWLSAYPCQCIVIGSKPSFVTVTYTEVSVCSESNGGVGNLRRYYHLRPRRDADQVSGR